MNNKNKKNKKQRRIFLAILLVVLTGSALVSSTYAWFTANRTVSINSINVNVSAQNGLQISADATNWKTILSNEDIIEPARYATAVNQIPTTLSPVSTDGTIRPNGYFDMYDGLIAANDAGVYKLTATQIANETATPAGGRASADGKYVAFDVFFSVNKPSKIYLTDSSGVALTATSAASGIQNSSRIGFVIEGNASSGTAVADLQALKATANTTANITVVDDEGTEEVVQQKNSIIWEPNNNVHTAAGISNGNDNYSSITGTVTGATVCPYYGVKAAITEGVDLDTTDSTIVTAINDTRSGYKFLSTNNGSEGGTNIFALDKGVTKVRVYMWVEGQDIDCENTASGGSMDFNIGFSLDNE